ncbi:MAG TPA: tetratricopeptide repeat protein, partial [Polyangiaceae bacterium]|nr:tetratricopeptide repeat protein [Polyangiaceae bacterium]
GARGARAVQQLQEANDLPPALSDLPAVSADLPALSDSRSSRHASLPAPAAALPARTPASRSAGAALPAPLAGTRNFGEIDLPLVSDSLPLVVPGELPQVAETLPRVAESLPRVAEMLPRVAETLPRVAESLPQVTESLPRVASGDRFGQSHDVHESDSAGGFGEIDLPREMPPSPRNPPSPPPPSPGDDLQLEDGPRPRRSGSMGVARQDASRADGGMAFGEVDLGSTAGGSEPPSAGIESETVATPDASARGTATSWNPPAPAVSSEDHAARGPVLRVPKIRKTSRRAAVALVVLAIFLTGGAALQLTPYGAYGYLVVTDFLRAGEYVRTTGATMREVEATLGPDTYEAAKKAVARSYEAHARLRRARPLTAYAALIDAAVTVRFGPDASRASRANQLLAELPADQDIRYRDLAAVAQAAERGELEKAAKMLQSAERRTGATDPAQVDAALLGGDIALASGNPSAALEEFKRALSLSNDARAHFGLARAYDGLGSAADAKKEIDATLGLSPGHAGALTLRARRQSAAVDPAAALADLATVLDGPVRASASAAELSDAYAARAWIELERGQASEARDAFADAVKLNPSNVGALNGQGRLLLNEGRSTEALARFDTALGLAPNSPATIANDAEAKLALERLADAKQQLTAARERFPNDIGILLLLGKVERHLGNQDAAEADLRAAISHVDPTRADAVLPFATLSELQSARGRLADARATLDEAKKKLPESSALDRALGQFDELQGDYEGATAHYRAAIAREPKEAAAHFRLAVVLRRLRRFDEASAQLDKVAEVDHDYPGLLLERGLLFEDSGDVNHAIEQFKTALAKAPEDPDLQLRVGSAYVAIDRPDDALPMLRKVLEKRPTSAEANHYIGRALMLKGGTAHPEALRYLKRAVELDPNRAEFHVYVAWAANEATPAQLELARDEVDRAMELDKLSAEAYWQRGILERMEGAVDDAIKDEKRAMDLRPTRYEAHATLAECYEDKNDEADALAEWQRAIVGDGDTRSSDGLVGHPYWHYRYGKLLLERGASAAALAQLLPAVVSAEKMENRPGWLAPLEFLVAEALRSGGRRSEAIEHYQHFLDIAPLSSPDRYDAERALKELGRP